MLKTNPLIEWVWTRTHHACCSSLCSTPRRQHHLLSQQPGRRPADAVCQRLSHNSVSVSQGSVFRQTCAPRSKSSSYVTLRMRSSGCERGTSCAWFCWTPSDRSHIVFFGHFSSGWSSPEVERYWEKKNVGLWIMTVQSVNGTRLCLKVPIPQLQSSNDMFDLMAIFCFLL